VRSKLNNCQLSLRDFRGQSCINDFLLVEYISSFFNETARANLVATSVEMLGYRISNVAEVKSVSSAVLEASEISGNVVKGGASLSLVDSYREGNRVISGVSWRQRQTRTRRFSLVSYFTAHTRTARENRLLTL